MTARSGSQTAPLGRLGGIGVNDLPPRQAVSLVIVLAAATIAGYSIFVWMWGTGRRAAPDYSVGTAVRQTLVSVANASGTADAIQQVKLSFLSGGKIAKLAVKQGDTVQAGQTIATIDSTALAIKRDTAHSQLNDAQIKLQALLDGATPADIAAQRQAVASAQSTLATAQNTLTNVLTGVTPQDVAAAQADLDRAKATLDVAQTNYDKLA